MYWLVNFSVDRITWKDLRCPTVNGIAKGVGSGSNKQVAKEEAARQAYYAMGWT